MVSVRMFRSVILSARLISYAGLPGRGRRSTQHVLLPLVDVDPPPDFCGTGTGR
jgi:hypothetical protein